MNAMRAVGRLSEILERLSAQGFDTRPLVVDPPASAEDIAAIEERLGCQIPPSLKHVLTIVASRVQFAWFAPPGHSFPDPFGHIFAANLSWSVDDLPDLMTAVREWIANAFPDPDDPYDRVWHSKLPFMEVGNGDYLALDLNHNDGQVIYLSHDDGEGHGRTMAPSFEELLTRWIPIACPGAEDWQWLSFCPTPNAGIDPTSAAASKWADLLHLEIADPDAVRKERVHKWGARH